MSVVVTEQLDERRWQQCVSGNRDRGLARWNLGDLSTILKAIPKSLPAAIAIVQHRTSEPSPLADVLSHLSHRTVRDAASGDLLVPGGIFLAPAGRHLLINADGTLSLSDSPKIRWSRPSVDKLFESAAESLGGRLIAVVLTGGDHDGANGIETVHRMGGRVIVQDPKTAEASGMPVSAITTGCVDFILPLDEIGPILARLSRGILKQAN